GCRCRCRGKAGSSQGFFQRRDLAGRQMEAELGPPPQDVLGSRRPFLAAQIVDLALVERRAEMPAEIAERLGPVEQPLGARAVTACIMQSRRRRQPAMAL